MFRSALHLRLLRSSGPGILGISGPGIELSGDEGDTMTMMTGWWFGT